MHIRVVGRYNTALPLIGKTKNRRFAGTQIWGGIPACKMFTIALSIFLIPNKDVEGQTINIMWITSFLILCFVAIL
jgi:hypothetical protein